MGTHTREREIQELSDMAMQYARRAEYARDAGDFSAAGRLADKAAAYAKKARELENPGCHERKYTNALPRRRNVIIVDA